MIKYVTDTCSLMNYLPEIKFEETIINALVLKELEKHKSDSRFPDKQKAARDALHAIENNAHLIEFDFKQYPTFEYLNDDYDISYTDNRLLESLFHHKKSGRKVGLLSDDLSLRLQASAFGFPVKAAENRNKTLYQGTIPYEVNDPRVSDFYNIIHSNAKTHENIFGLIYGQYLIIRDSSKQTDEDKEKNKEIILGAWRWDGVRYIPISMNQTFSSSYIPEVRPKNFRQAIAMDSLKNNPLTALTGKAGTGKSYLSFAYIMEQIDKYDRKIYIVTDNIPLRGSSTFGLKKGDIITKILQSNLGNIIKSKIGMEVALDLIDRGLLNIIALEDLRGVSLNSILYITEVQNYTIDGLKSALERLEEESGRAILDGDKRQIDIPYARGSNSGIDRMFEVFQGSPYLGHVELVENHRGGISALAEKM